MTRSTVSELAHVRIVDPLPSPGSTRACTSRRSATVTVRPHVAPSFPMFRMRVTSLPLICRSSASRPLMVRSLSTMSCEARMMVRSDSSGEKRIVSAGLASTMAWRSVPGPLSAFEVTQTSAASIRAVHANNANTTGRTRRTSDGIRRRNTNPSRSRAPEQEGSGQPKMSPGVVRDDQSRYRPPSTALECAPHRCSRLHAPARTIRWDTQPEQGYDVVIAIDMVAGIRLS